MSMPVRRSFTKHVSLHVDKDAELIAFMDKFNFSGKTKELWMKAMEEEKGTAIPPHNHEPRQQTTLKVEVNDNTDDLWTVE